MMEIHNIFNKAFIGLLLSAALTGCKSYSASFGCADANGLKCVPLSVVDQRIDSGEIEEVELRNCSSRECKARLAKKPSLRANKFVETLVINDNSDDGDAEKLKENSYAQ